MLSKIAGFEFRYQMWSPTFVVVFLIFFLLAFGSMASESVQIGGTAAVHANSPHAITLTILILTVFGVFIPTVFLVSGVLRDSDYKTEEIFYTTPVRERSYLSGRFLGAFVVTLLCFASVPLALLIGSLMPWVDPESLGPLNPGQYLYAFVIFAIPNMLIIGMISFTVANFTRSTIATYTALVGLIILYFVGNAILNEPSYRQIVALFDPFGLNTYGEAIRYWTPFELNEKLVPLEGTLVLNRLLWLGVALVLFFANLSIFSFQKRAPLRIFGRKKVAQNVEGHFVPARVTLPRSTPTLGRAAGWAQFRARVAFEIKGVLKSVAFWVMLVLGMANALGALMNLGLIFGTPILPVTSAMITTIGGTFGIIPMIVVIYYASEVVWKERSVFFADIIDATPTPNWAFVFSKFLGLCLVVVGLMSVSALMAILVQVFNGFSDLELKQYAMRIGIDFILPFSMIAALSLFAQVLTNNRWMGILVMVVYIIGTMVLPNLGYEDRLYLFVSVGGTPYNDMNGFGQFLAITLWYHLYWAFFSALLLVLTYLLWNRGALAPLGQRLRHLPSALTPATSAVVLVSLVGFVATGGFIYTNTHVLNEYVTQRQIEERTADYEKTYVAYRDMVVPKITDVAIDVDIFPRERRYQARGSYVLVNKSEEPIELVLVGYGPGTTVQSQTLEGASVSEQDDRFLVTHFAFDPPMAPGEKRVLTFEVERANPGFRNSGNVTTANYNGSFFNNQESMPQLGYRAGLILTDPQARRRQDLEPTERMPKIDDESQWTVNGLSPTADYVTFKTTVSTSEDQIAIAPGYLKKQWTEGGRKYFSYEMDAPIMNFYAWLSADYAVLEDSWNDVLLQVFYHPGHNYNVERMMEAMKASLGYFSENFSPYQYRQARILEFPGYQSFAQSFPNTIPFSEAIGFLADNSDPDDIDYPYYVTAHEIAHQWWAHQVMSANVQGGTMLVETFSQYSALMVMEKRYGADHMRRFLKYELDRYLSGRGAEAIEELPLYLVENQQYIHYRKGSVVMYALKDYLGEDRVNKVMRELIELRAFRSDPYATTLDFLRLLRAEAGPDYETLIQDLFEKIVLFDLKVKKAEAWPLDDGTWQVVLDVEANKFEADGTGAETEVPLDYMIDVGVFTQNLDDPIEGTDHVLYMEKQQINEDSMQIKLVVDQKPKYAGLDPYNKLIDRNSDDNLLAVDIVDAPKS